MKKYASQIRAITAIIIAIRQRSLSIIEIDNALTNETPGAHEALARCIGLTISVAGGCIEHDLQDPGLRFAVVDCLRRVSNVGRILALKNLRDKYEAAA